MQQLLLYEYEIFAKITVDEQLLFITTTSNPVIKRGNPIEIDVILEKGN